MWSEPGLLPSEQFSQPFRPGFALAATSVLDIDVAENLFDMSSASRPTGLPTLLASRLSAHTPKGI